MLGNVSKQRGKVYILHVDKDDHKSVSQFALDHDLSIKEATAKIIQTHPKLRKKAEATNGK